MPLKKEELIRAIADDVDLPASRLTVMYDSLVKVIQAEIAKGEEVNLPGLFSIKHKAKPARTGRNPSTGAAIEIAAKNTLTITPLKPLKDVIPQPK